VVSRHMLLGASGEDAAARWYERAGYDVIGRNWRCPEGELDLVLRRGRLVVFCEVKTRSSDRFGSPAEAVTYRKQARLRRLAARWLASRAATSHWAVRFDVAAVRGNAVEVIEDAF
jgi:putative endonuclease